jgi:glycine/serine hydroxymethyltransferase
MGATEFEQIGGWIADVLENGDEAAIAKVAAEVRELCARFPLYAALRREQVADLV